MESDVEQPDEQPAAPTVDREDEAAAAEETAIGATTDPAPDAPAAMDDAQVDTLAGSLLWRIGHVFEDGPVTVRVGLASAAPLFADLPRLRAATDQEVEAAVTEGDVQVEWVGPRLGGRS